MRFKQVVTQLFATRKIKAGLPELITTHYEKWKWSVRIELEASTDLLRYIHDSATS